MGGRGTEVAREVADMVITDDNFASIVAAMRQGRAIDSNIPELVPGVMDRPPRGRDERLLAGRRLLHAYGFLGVIEAVLSLSGFFWTYWLAGWRPGLPMAGAGALCRRATTMTLAGIVAAQVGNVFACRTDRESVFRIGVASNPLVLLGIAAEIGGLIGLIVIPPLRAIFGLEHLVFREWGLLLLFPPLILIAEEARKLGLRRWRRNAVTARPRA